MIIKTVIEYVLSTSNYNVVFKEIEGSELIRLDAPAGGKIILKKEALYEIVRFLKKLDTD